MEQPGVGERADSGIIRINICVFDPDREHTVFHFLFIYLFHAL